MDERLSVIAAVLGSPQGCAAVAGGDSGTVVLLARRALGWTQQELAARSGYSQPTISRLERGRTRATRDTVILVDLAQTLDLPVSTFGLATVLGGEPRTLDKVRRRDFINGAVTLTVAALLPQAITTATGRIGATEVAQCWTSLHRLDELDNHEGGGGVYQLAAEMAVQLQNALRRTSYSPAVGRELEAVTATAMEHAGWTAYDAGWEEQARHWWLEACHLGELAGIRDARVTALGSMSLEAGRDPARSRETVALAEATRAAA
ncbi:MAG: helix-turn-helix domain-containing protein, partial [Pseudonocardia sp.]